MSGDREGSVYEHAFPFKMRIYIIQVTEALH